MTVPSERLMELRHTLVRLDLDGFVLTLTDEHLSEYVRADARRLSWLTGFQGSSGWAVVLSTDAGIFVDGRYTLQVRQQVDERHWSFHPLAESNVNRWLGERAPPDSRIGYDPWLHTRDWVGAARSVLAKQRGELIPVDPNPIDALWQDRPVASGATLVAHPNALSGKSSAEKRRDIAQWLTTKRADVVLLASPDSIAWTFNVRGNDIEHTPVALAYASVAADGTADLFVDAKDLGSDVIQHLGAEVRLHSRAEFISRLQALTGQVVAADPDRTVVAIFDALEVAGAQVVEERDPVVIAKAIKNSVEIVGQKTTHAVDGAALSRFLHWFSVEAPSGTLTEMLAATRVRQFRESTGQLRDLSFETISAAGPNGALPHYRVTEATNRPIERGTLYLIDSGGQYACGTTDVTRTIAVGAPSIEMRDRFTRVLKGHIALATAIFPEGTRGIQLDLLARQYLWQAGVDYPHGTGHGVGSYLCVHEGPQRIAYTSAPTGDCMEPLRAGMVVSNEPGYYKMSEYGIRIENLMLVVKHDVVGAEFEMLAFETLTVAPLDRMLIDISMLTANERAWVNTYHLKVWETVGPLLDGAAQTWLREETRALTL